MTTAAPKSRIATVKGVFAVPGVSKNRRLYTKAHIAGAVQEANAAIASGDGPLLAMLTHHGARNPSTGDVTRTAGRLTKVGLDEAGNGTFEADIADTEAGRDVAALVTPEQPYLKGVSMAGMWKGDVRTVHTEDGPAETADGFLLKGIDFTHAPGVPGAEIHSAHIAEAAGAPLVFESMEEVVFVEDGEIGEGGNAPGTGAKPYGKVTYADPGYQKDKKERYPLDTKAHARAAWSYINKPKNQTPYTAAQLKRIKGRIKAAAARFGIKITEEAAATALAALTEAFIEGLPEQITEAMASVIVTNGPADISVSAYGNDPADLQAVVGRLADAVLAALDVIDPDAVGDIGLKPDPGEDDTDMESATPTESAPADPSNKEAPMGTTTDPGAATETVTLTQAELDARIAEAVAAAAVPAEPEESEELKAARKLIAEADATAAPAAPAAPAPTAEAAPLTVELLNEALATQAAKFEEQLGEARREIANAGTRKGRVPRPVLEQAPEELYGADGVSASTSTQDLERLADVVVTPLLAAV